MHALTQEGPQQDLPASSLQEITLHTLTHQVIPGLWWQGATASQALQAQNTLRTRPGVYLSESEEAFVLGQDNAASLYLHPLPRIITHEHDRIADNTDAPLSMERLLFNVTHCFSDDPANALPHIDIATAFLYRSGLQHILQLLHNPHIQRLRLLFSGKADRSTVELLQQVFLSSLDDMEQDKTAPHPDYTLLAEAVEAGRFRIRVYPHAFLHAKLYLGYDFLDNQGFFSKRTALIGSSNITGPGILQRGNLELNVAIEERIAVKNLYQWFEARWDEAEEPRPVLLEALQHKRAPVTPPTFAIEGLLEVWRAGQRKQLLPPAAYLTFLARLYRKPIGLTPEALSLPAYPADSARQITPSPEQESGVLALAHRLLQLRFAFLADSVGLGKTITALGTAWYLYRLQQAERVAVIAPKKLMRQWRLDTHHIRMPDNLVTYLNRHKLERKDEADAAERLAPFDLLIVEEAHEALRNRRNKLWNHIRRHLQRHPGCRLLLVSATPWNNTREDIFNYILLAWQDGPSLPNHYPTLAQAPFYEGFRLFHGQPSRAAATFADLGLDVYRNIFDTTFVQRTRHRISLMYQQAFDFPERNVTPYQLSPSEPHDQYFRSLEAALERLHIPYREPFRALQRAARRALPEVPQDLEELPPSNLHRGFLIQLYKRAESSLFALAVSLKQIERRLIKLEQELIQLVHTQDSPKAALLQWLEKTYLRLNQEALSDANANESDTRPSNPNLDGNDTDLDSLDTDLLSPAEKARYGALQSFFADLDDAAVQAVVRNLIENEVAQDQREVHDLCDALTLTLERQAPKNLLLIDLLHLHLEKRRKVVMIGSFTDTAVRAFLRLLAAFPERRIGLALGGNEGWLYDPSTHRASLLTDNEWTRALALSPKERRTALLQEAQRAAPMSREQLLQAFAPRAQKVSPDRLQRLGGEIDILLGTEAISMGQNLQDATSLIHLDMPWNPMVLEQRIGRVDRRGGGRLSDPNDPHSPKVVDIHYFWSQAAIENEIALRDKLKSKSESAIQDTNFDELLLYELRDLIAQVRERNQHNHTPDVQPEEIASLLRDRQRDLAHSQNVPPEIAADEGSTLDGIRQLAAWVQANHVDLDVPPEPVVACGYRSQPNERGRWLVTVALQPRDAAGHPLGAEQTETLLLPRQPDQPILHDVETVVLNLQQADDEQRHQLAPHASAPQWQSILQALEQQLLHFREQTLAQHNQQVHQTAQRALQQKRPSPTENFRKLCLRAYDALQACFHHPYYNAPAGIALLEERGERLVFLVEHLSVTYADLLYTQTNLDDVEAALHYIASQTRRFLDEEFDEFFALAVGELWNARQAHNETGEQLALPHTRAEGRWDQLDIRFLAAAYIV